jgi:uncharacterized damage-inducible protein DinB
MRVRAEQLAALRADGPVAEGSAFGGAGDDADVLRHGGRYPTSEVFGGLAGEPTGGGRILRDGLSVPGGTLSGMTGSDPKADLQRYLQAGREALLWKLEGLSEYDIRRPLTPTGTNLLGLVKHVAIVEAGYLGDTFGRPFDEPQHWSPDEPNSDMWATPQESREQITGLYRRVWAHSDKTIDALALEATGRVPWWPGERSEVTLHQILVHMIAETHRHAGHADIVRELIDGAAGLRNGSDNMPAGDQAWWDSYRSRLEQVAQGRARTDQSLRALRQRGAQGGERGLMSGAGEDDVVASEAFAIAVHRIEDDRIVEVTTFHDPYLLAVFALPLALSQDCHAVGFGEVGLDQDAKSGVADRADSLRPFGSSHSSWRPSAVRSRK